MLAKAWLMFASKLAAVLVALAGPKVNYALFEIIADGTYARLFAAHVIQGVAPRQQE